MKTGTLEPHEREIVDFYVARWHKANAVAQDTHQVFNDLMKLIYPEWNPSTCLYNDGIITDPQD